MTPVDPTLGIILKEMREMRAKLQEADDQLRTRLDSIDARQGDIEKNSAAHHARVEGEMARIGDRIDALAERVKIQNGRVNAAERRLNELETKQRIAERDDQQDDQRSDIVEARIWSFISGAGLVALGTLLGYFL